LAVARGRLENQLAGLTYPPKAGEANERWPGTGEFTAMTCSRSCVRGGLDDTNWRTGWAIRFGVLRKVRGGSRPWAGAVLADVGLADVLAIEAFSPGLPRPTPQRHAGGNRIAPPPTASVPAPRKDACAFAFRPVLRASRMRHRERSVVKRSALR
jgi:hypothetical protein